MGLHFMVLFLYSQPVFEASEPETCLPTQDIREDIATEPEVSTTNHELL